MNILVTGSTGFVGKRFMNLSNNFKLEPISLRNENWKSLDFSKKDCILHLAGKAHDMEASDGTAYYEVNVDLTKALVEKAIADGVPHFIYISSIKVYGDTVNEVITESSAYAPNDDYGKSKQQAEELLLKYQDKIKITIIRPPLIYGPNVKGNMAKLMALAKKSIPLPLGNINNKRSVVFLDNLIDLIHTVITQKQEGIFLPTDGSPVSTTDIVRTIREQLGQKANLIGIPIFVQKVVKKLKPELYTRMFGSYILNDTATRKKLNFSPNYSFEQGIKSMLTENES